MSPDLFHEVALRLPGARFDVKWGNERIYSVGPKMFAFAGHLGDLQPRYAFKTSEMSFDLLIAQKIARPAPYLARARWVQLMAHDALPADELSAYISQAHHIVAASLTRKLRATLGLSV